MIFDIKMSEFMKKDMTEFVGRKKDYLPIKIEVAPRGTRAKTRRLVADGNVMIIKTKLLFERG